MAKNKCDCKICCFDLIPKITGSRNCFDICMEYPVLQGHDDPAVTYCPFNGLWTYYLSDRPDFKCKYFVNRESLERAPSKGKITQYKELYADQLYQTLIFA
jgi:hypothetical protein